jgi:hypothetical protein
MFRILDSKFNDNCFLSFIFVSFKFAISSSVNKPFLINGKNIQDFSVTTLLNTDYPNNK